MLFMHLASLQTYTGEFATIKYYLWRIYSDKSKHLFKLQLEESYKHQDLFSFSGFSILNQLLQELILLVISLTLFFFSSSSFLSHLSHLSQDTMSASEYFSFQFCCCPDRHHNRLTCLTFYCYICSPFSLFLKTFSLACTAIRL